MSLLFGDPMHPLHWGLLGSIPKLTVEQERLQVIEGVVPDPAYMPEGL